MIKRLLYQGKTIVYGDIGSGFPLMLLHGFGEDARVWEQQVDYLKDKFRIITPDLPGSGGSELIEDMSMEGMAEVVRTILNDATATSTEKPVLIGHSMGGYIALAFVEKYESTLSAFGLFHSSAYPDTPEKIATRQKGILAIQEHGAFEFLRTVTPNLYSPGTREQSPGMIEKEINLLTGFTAEALIAYYKAMINRPDRTPILRKTTLPVLFILGQFDQAIPLKDGLEQCHLPARSILHLLRRSGHMGMQEEAGKVNSILENLLTTSSEDNF